jgi:hypothetical protein
VAIETQSNLISADAMDVIDVDDTLIDFTPDHALLARASVRHTRLPWLAICAAIACCVMAAALFALKPTPNAARADMQPVQSAPKKFELFPLPEFQE